MLEIDHPWTSTGSSGGLAPVYLDGFQTDSVLQVAFSTLATTNSVSFQTAISSGGPWATEASTTISTLAAGMVSLRVTGPYTWMRPYLHTASTGTYTLRLIAAS